MAGVHRVRIRFRKRMRDVEMTSSRGSGETSVAPDVLRLGRRRARRDDQDRDRCQGHERQATDASHGGGGRPHRSRVCSRRHSHVCGGGDESDENACAYVLARPML